MRRRLLIALVVAGLGVAEARAQDGKATLDAAAKALGSANLNSIQFSGRGSDYIFGQPYDPNTPWPRFNLPAFTTTIDYTTPAIRDDRRRAQVQNPPLGGGTQPLAAEMRQIWLLSGTYAWDLVDERAVPAVPERDQRTAVDGRLAQIWMTPHGFIKAAMAGNATVTTETVRGAKKTIVSVTTPNKAKFEGMLNDQNLVERIETWVGNPILGDMMIEAVFKDYKDFGGVKFPTHILQRSGGYPLLDLTVTDVKPNAPASIEVPPAIRTGKPAPEPISPQKISDGIWIVPGGAKSIVVEFRDHIMVIDAPATEARSIAVIDAVKKIIPGKPIRYVVNTHLHFDHSGGLATVCGGGRDGDYAPRQHSVLRAGVGQPADDQSGSAVEVRPQAGVRRRGGQPDVHRRLARSVHLSLPWKHAQRRHADDLSAQGEDPDRGRLVFTARQPERAAQRRGEPGALV